MTTTTKTTARAEVYDTAIANHWKVVDVTECWTHTTYGRSYGTGSTHTVTRFIIEPDFSAGGDWPEQQRLVVLFTESDAFFGAWTGYLSGPIPDSHYLNGMNRWRLTKARTLTFLRDENGPARKLRRELCAAARLECDERRLRTHDAAVTEAYGPALEEAMWAWNNIVYAVLHELPEGLDEPRQVAEAITAKLVGDDNNPGTVALYLAAHHKAKRIGEGWLPGQTSLSGTYVNGRRVSE